MLKFILAHFLYASQLAPFHILYSILTLYYERIKYNIKFEGLYFTRFGLLLWSFLLLLPITGYLAEGCL